MAWDNRPLRVSLARAGPLLAGAIALLSGPAAAQIPTVEDLRGLIGERETEIARLEPQLEGLDVRVDSLGQLKRTLPPGGPRFEAVSNEILQVSGRRSRVARSLRVLYEQVRDLRTELFLAYNQAISETQTRIDSLTGESRTSQNSQEVRRLVETQRGYVQERERLAREIEEARDDLFLIDLAIDPNDGPRELERKEAIARDLVDKIDREIGAIEEQIDAAVRKQREREEMSRIKDDIALWGDDQAARGAGEIEAILEGRGAGPGLGSQGDVFDDPDTRIQQLQSRRLELIDRRAEYQAKADLFADRLRELYR